MPNHVKNIVSARESVIKSMLDSENFVDFCCVIPRHDDLLLNDADSVCSGAESLAKLVCKEACSEQSVIAALEAANRNSVNALKMSDESFEQFVMMVRNKRKHGYYHMMDYARNAWGTKWNAYGQDVEKNTETQVEFDTAWSHPLPVIIALSKKHPEEVISVKFADEDTGSNCGSYKIKNGETFEEDIAPSWRDQTAEQKKKFTQFAFELRHPGVDPISYGYNKNWEYDEDAEAEYYAEQEAKSN